MENLIREAREVGIKNPTIYWLLPPKKREKALAEDIKKVKQKDHADTGK